MARRSRPCRFARRSIVHRCCHRAAPGTTSSTAWRAKDSRQPLSITSLTKNNTKQPAPHRRSRCINPQAKIRKRKIQIGACGCWQVQAGRRALCHRTANRALASSAWEMGVCLKGSCGRNLARAITPCSAPGIHSGYVSPQTIYLSFWFPVGGGQGSFQAGFSSERPRQRWALGAAGFRAERTRSTACDNDGDRDSARMMASTPGQPRHGRTREDPVTTIRPAAVETTKTLFASLPKNGPDYSCCGEGSTLH